MSNNRESENTGIWEQRFCITPRCHTDTLYVMRRGEGLDLWRVSEHPNQPEWLIASIVPICPLCGGHLATRYNLDDGIDALAA